MNDHDARADSGAPAAGSRPQRKDRLPLGRFLLMFGVLLAAALGLAALAPAASDSPGGEGQTTATASNTTPGD